MPKTKISVIYLTIGALTFVSIFVSLALKSFDNLTSPTRKAQSKEVIRPIDTSLDIETIKVIEQREEFGSPPTPNP